MFLATLNGPGDVYLQSMPVSKLAERLYANLGSRGEQGSSGKGSGGMGAVVAGGILGGLLGRED